jgi:N utilization substance protein B
MALPPQKFREIVFQIFYSAGFPLPETEETALMLMSELKVTKKSVLEANEKVKQIHTKLVEIDEKISAHATGYSFERISRVEKAILRLGMYELLFEPSVDSFGGRPVPPLVVIAEAIRLTRKFGTFESAHFVNAVLDRVYKSFLLPSESNGTLICNEPATL